MIQSLQHGERFYQNTDKIKMKSLFLHAWRTICKIRCFLSYNNLSKFDPVSSTTEHCSEYTAVSTINIKRTKVFVLLVLALMSKNSLLHVSTRDSQPSCFTVSRRYGTENKAIIHSAHAYLLVSWACSLYCRYTYAGAYDVKNRAG